LNIFGFGVYKIKIFGLIPLVFIPCFVEAIPLDKTKVSPELMAGNALSFGVVAQYVDKTIEVPIVLADGLLGSFKGCNKGFCGFDLPLPPGVPTSKDSIPDSNSSSNRSGDDGSYDWCFYLSLHLLMLYSAWLSPKTLQRNIGLSSFNHDVENQPKL
jgi:hypothetical protein